MERSKQEGNWKGGEGENRVKSKGQKRDITEKRGKEGTTEGEGEKKNWEGGE